MDLVLTAATVPAIVALVNLGKTVGLPSKFAALLAVLLGIVLTLGDAYLGSVWANISSGIIVGLAAAGLYDLAPASPKRAIVE